jgi:V/A-type H+/Na+-transporting ATPase subunit E
MSDLDNVSKKVMDDAIKQKERELEEARKKASEIIEQAKKRALQVHREGKRKSWDKYREDLKIELSKIKSSLNQKILLYKINLVDEVVRKAKNQLEDIDREDFKKMLKKNIDALDINDGYYIIGSEEKKIDGKMVESVTNLKKLDEEPDFKKGIKIISGKAEYNISPGILIDSDIDDIRMETARVLFDNSRGSNS